MRIFVHVQVQELKLYPLIRIVSFLAITFHDCALSIFTKENITTFVLEVERRSLTEAETNVLNCLKDEEDLIVDWKLGKRIK